MDQRQVEGGVMGPRILLGIFTCHKYQYIVPGSDTRDWFTRPPVVDRVSAIRDTWLKDVTVDYKFFYGRGSGRSPQPDEVFLDAPDDYLHSADKLRGVIKYALAKDYDYLLKIDDDVYAYWKRIMQNVPTADYVGSSTGPVPVPDPTAVVWWKSRTANTTTYCSGMAYWLSKHALKVLSESAPGCWAEDRWAGESLYRKGIYGEIDGRYYIAPRTRTNQYITDAELAKPNDFLVIHSLTPDQMRRHWKESQ
jgi:hypothetical protein